MPLEEIGGAAVLSLLPARQVSPSVDDDSQCRSCFWYGGVPGIAVQVIEQTCRRNHGCRTSKHKAREVERHRPSDENPVVSVVSLLLLADWYVKLISLDQGADRCNENTERFPPALSNADRVAEGNLEGVSGGSPATNSDDTQPNRRSTNSAISTTEGGEL